MRMLLFRRRPCRSRRSPFRRTAACWRRLATGSWNGEVKLWDMTDGKLLLRLGPVERNFGMCFSPDGRKLATGDEQGMLQLWDLETGRRLAGVPAHSGNIFKTAFSPD